MHDDRGLVVARLRRVLAERVRPAVHRTVAPLEAEVWHVEGGQGEPVPPAVALGLLDGQAQPAYAPCRVGDPWGPAWGTSWFHLTGAVPSDVVGERVELLIDLGWTDRAPGFQAEGLVYRPDGQPVKGLNPFNGWVPLAPAAVGGEPVDVYVEAAANPAVMSALAFRPTRLGEKDTAGDQPLYRLARAEIAVLDIEVWEFVQDLEVLAGLAAELGDGEPRQWEIIKALERSLDVLDVDDVAGTSAAARAELADALARPASASAHRVSAVGHAHIDSAWLWPVREAVRKVARTTSNVVALMDEHPDLMYAMSSAQQFAWIEEHRPEVFARMAEWVRDGRFVPVGGMWVESDTNLPGGEAMVRQLVHGKGYFLDRFGIETQEVWLPDSFGYSAALPQLVRLSGSRWFLTQKVSWNQTNRFPHHSFWWEGIDGTRVFTHFPPVDTYNSELSGAELAHAVRNFRDKGSATRSLVPFGHGDGGGGPTREMLARARRTADLEGSPRVTIEAPSSFFAAAEEEYADGPVWVGELYLELHRATYTSQARMKQGNRRSEHLLREAELWSTVAAIRGLIDYPYDRLDRLWKTVLLHQFHDILPGSSIAWVHREARTTYANVATELETIIETATTALTGNGDGETIFNATPNERAGVPALAAGPRASGRSDQVVTVSETDSGHVLDNGRLQVVVDGRGLVTSVVDLDHDREVLPPDRIANLLQLHPDLPVQWDAWDVDAYYRHTGVDLVDVDGVDLTGPDADGAVTLRVRRSFGASKVVQHVTLCPGVRRVDFCVDVDWREQEKFLKVALPIDVHGDRAAYETQFGHVFRPTHQNTSWEAAKFEVCAHRWVHVGETGYGVAVVNDATYGHDIRREPRSGGGTSTTVRLSLLRAPRYPDPETDQDRHVLRYALLPGASIGDAVREGYAINLPERRVAGAEVVAPVIRVDGPGAEAVVIEAIKLADDRSGDIVVRLYESLGSRARVTVIPDFDASAITETDLLERPIEPTATDGTPTAGSVALQLRPFQIVTLRLRPS